MNEINKIEKDNKTMKNLIIFENNSFGNVRVFYIDNTPYFVGKDIAEILGYSNPSKAIINHVDIEDKKFIMVDLAGYQNGNMSVGKTKTAFINESGLYSLILSSKLPKAKEFKRWVTSEVLPTIRDTGEYKTSKKNKEDLATSNETAKIILPFFDALGSSTEMKAYFLKQLYRKADLELPFERYEQKDKLFDKTTIAKEIGVLSNKGKPHSQAIGAIISKLNIGEDEKVLTSYEKNGHIGTDYQYKESVVNKIQNWISKNNYPTIITKDDKSYKVTYKSIVIE